MGPHIQISSWIAYKKTLNPVGHQSTNWTDFEALIEAMAAFTSLGTTSPR